ncbi:hypothetical protein [Brevibacillus borstelensis]|uniref:hypothetical protein n=1 Tax=Brevibacillus borstelensis TaxID=45462 RepID=UPI0030BA3BB1
MKRAFRKILLCGVAVSALTLGSQAAFASEIKQNQTQQLNKGESKVQAETQNQNAFFWFNRSRLDSRGVASSGKFTIDSRTSVKLAAFLGSVSYPVFPDAKVYIVNDYGQVLSMSIIGKQYNEENFVLEPGAYYLECVNYSSGPIYMNVSLYKN